ncbi:MAG: serine O-acetyltransferase EpsC [Humidesulfovibrio sp.]|uniref:serine O-acetyltransferase EpsC n=1 Tax=Humidesulfovibrio sp. TaxID=2910988 RepID=UPI0027351E82|nr:serine O-acetyltransferase EpsC [Humidesulfovibrio sp.]MDP2846867.1 serine O-acetyltransferase EpsC [Humidesulfovibrio sp.]
MIDELILPANLDRDEVLAETVARLCAPTACESACHHISRDQPMPSLDALAEVMDLLRAVLFPGFFGPSDVSGRTMSFYTGSALDRVVKLLAEQINRGYCFVCAKDNRQPCTDCESRSEAVALEFVKRLPRVRELLSSDVLAAYDGDPAAKSPGETIFCYPSIKALTNHRIAHQLHHLGVDIIPRIIGEMAHSDTGIDIHPGAHIGPRFFIDHGTGTVIGETCIIGQNVRLYQGVTLGAKSFPKEDSSSRLVKGLARHPIVEDDVTIYAGATILGRVTIGQGAVIGGNVWVTGDVAPGARIVQARAAEQFFISGGGI